MTSLQSTVARWLDSVEAKSTKDGADAADLANLRKLVQSAAPKQRLLYLHTQTPSVKSRVIGMAQYEPDPDGIDILRTREEWPYGTVHEAVVDGWQVIQFPNLQSPYDDKEMSYVGFEFILQKWEEVVHE